MTVGDVKQHIKTKSLLPYYVFTGDELEVMNRFVVKIAEVAEATICRADTLSSVFSKMQNKSFLSRKTCYVVRDDKEYLSAEDIWPRLESGELQNNNIVILLYSDLDKRSKFYKHIKDSLVVFDALTDENLKREIQKRVALSDRNCAELIDICERSLGAILNEVDKIVQYEGNAKFPNPNTTFEYLLDSGAIHQPARDVIWDFVEAVLTRKVRRSFGLLQEALEYGNPTLTLLSVLYKDTRQLLQVQGCQSQDISKTTGLSGWDIKRAMSRAGKYTIRELVSAMKVFREVEVGIKSGTIEESIALEYALTEVLK